MRVEEICLRQEIRQMLNEAGINKNTLKEMVKDVLKEEVEKACTQGINESDFEGYIRKKMDDELGQLTRKIIRESIVDRVVKKYFDRMHVTVEIKDEDGRALKN